VAVLFLFITVPFSGARTCSALLLTFLLLSLGRWVVRLRRRQADTGPAGGTGRWAPLIVVLAVLLGGLATWYIAKDTITQRAEKTVVQVHEFKAMGGLGSRSGLYRATWKMATDRFVFGWGMGSYPTVFQMYNTEQISRQDLLPHFYHDAHSDWLQAMAEHGLIGTLLLGCCALVPLLTMGAAAWSNRLSRYGFAGCTVVLLYSWVELPFGNYAVALTWWMIFFAAARYGVLSPQRTRVAHDLSSAPTDGG
jgi:O-antigen ligase